MALEGTLSDFGLADIFQLISIQLKSGVLTLSSGDEKVLVYFRKGKVINADASGGEGENRIGNVWVRTGRLTSGQLEEALKVQQETFQQLGHVVVNLGFLEEEELRQSLEMQVNETIYRLFRWTEGEYHFDQDADIVGMDGGFPPLSCEGILMEGVRMLDEWPIVESRIASREMVFKKLRPGSKVQVVEDGTEIDRMDDGALRELLGPGYRPDEFVPLTTKESVVYEKIDGKRSVQAIVDSVSLYEFDACKSLYDMAERAIIAEASQREILSAPARPGVRQIAPGLVYALYAVLIVWLTAAVATNRMNPLNYLTVPPPEALKADSLKALQFGLKLSRLKILLEAYRMREGRFPGSLDELASSGRFFAVEVIEFKEHGIRYRVVPGGYSLESHPQ